MPRTRLTVALVPPAHLLEPIQVLRRAVDDPRVDRLSPHVTLVPPVNLPDEEVADAHRLVRRAATAAEPFTLELGGAATFAPGTPTLHLSVHGDLAALSGLREALMVPPFGRPDPRPFVPHVTLRRQLDPDLLPGAVGTLVGRLGRWQVDDLIVLRHRNDEQGSRWEPVREEPLGGPTTVGRGGIEVRLRSCSFHEPEVADLLGIDDASDQPARREVSVAESPDAPMRPIGAATGRIEGATGMLDGLLVDPAHRRSGIASHLLAHWCSSVAQQDAVLAVAGPIGAGSPAVAALLAQRGFVPVGDLLVRRL